VFAGEQTHREGEIQAGPSTVRATSAVAGPAVGGLLAAYADWRGIFLISLPAGTVALRLMGRHLHEPARPRPAARPRVDALPRPPTPEPGKRLPARAGLACLSRPPYWSSGRRAQNWLTMSST
jgi:MFS family permease